MSRHGYRDDCDEWELICWRGAVTSAIRGKRGQKFLRELASAMDAMPEKVLISGELRDSQGDYCAIGIVGAVRGMDMQRIDIDDRESVASAFGIAEAMAAEIMYENDDGGSWEESPARRWQRVRKWVDRQLAQEGGNSNG